MNRIIPKIDLTAASGEARLHSGLVYIASLENGITRRQGRKGFLYYLPDGSRIADHAEIARLDALAVPPAYSNVVISTNPLSHLQAIGTDAQGRRQYCYHPDWRSERDRAKFDRLVEFADRLPDIRQQVDADLRSRGLTMEKALATVVSLLDKLYIRIGNTAYAEEHRTFGATTLRNHHVRVEGVSIRFRFRGKSGKEWNLVHSDRRIANVVRKLQELPGQQLFQYFDDEGGFRQISSQDVNEYIRSASGGDFTSRQFRTWGGTCMAVAALAPLNVETSESAIARQLNRAIDQVASKLGNTRSVCRSSYIHPGVLDDFRQGRLGQVLKIRTRSERFLRWMDLDEIRVRRWLKRRGQ